MVMDFSNFLPWAVYSSKVHSYKSWASSWWSSMAQLAKKEQKRFQQLSKQIKLRFTCTT